MGSCLSSDAGAAAAAAAATERSKHKSRGLSIIASKLKLPAEQKVESVLLDLGDSEEEEEDDDSDDDGAGRNRVGPAAAARRKKSHARSLRSRALKSLPEIPVEEQGLSLHFVEMFVQEHGLGAGRGGVTSADVCKKIIMPLTESMGCTLVEMAQPAERGRVTHFVSHPWGNEFHQTVNAALQAAYQWEKETGGKAHLWMDIFAVNQHKMARAEYSRDDINAMLKTAVECSQEVFACLHPWSDPLYIHRAWCLYESFVAREMSSDGRSRLRFVLSPDAAEQFEQEALSQEFDQILQVLANIDVRKADAYKTGDKDMILGFIEESAEGAKGLNQSVAASLRDWLVSNGRLIVEKRTRTHANSAKLSQILVNYGRLLGDQAQNDEEREEARACFEEALSIDEAILALYRLDPSGDSAKQQSNVARDLNFLGQCLYLQNDFDGALLRFTQAKDAYVAVHGSEDNVDVARVLTATGPAHMKLQNWEEAVASLRRASAIYRAAGSSFEAQALGYLAYVLSKNPSSEAFAGEAAQIREEVLKIRIELHGAQHPAVAMALLELGRGEEAAGNAADAVAFYKRALLVYEKIYGKDHRKARDVGLKIVAVSAARGARGAAARRTKARSRHKSTHEAPGQEVMKAFLPDNLSARAEPPH